MTAPIRFHRPVAFLDPPAPEHLPRGVVTWPLFAAAALAHVVHVLRGGGEIVFVAMVALVAQVLTLFVALFTLHRLLATGATRARLTRIIVLGVLAGASALLTARAATATLFKVELGCAALAVAIVARAALGWRHAL